ncbi:hypothetical protein [Marinagarivorans cellulosilyticus]|uniref:Uncharacterized protein n=1 Tax=Marinagarivorans cellulosilyticus TaxID=2721545 RepID=A0AAN1WIZ9_9GAMM|nr:hypothetical protein [Marinagarivorans cellulosilyticus]BCD98412.1 hypothetical protein MARGE09_P2613 [Marinagarivorans cellulosilyticus]
MQKHSATPDSSKPPASITLDDWSHVRETINMLYLAVCQIEATMSDSNASVDTLTQSFTTLASHNNEVSQKIQRVANPDELNAFKDDIVETAARMNTNINSSVQAFQFYDRVCQRLDHVARSLEKVSGVMNDQDSLHEPKEWRRIQNDIKDSYTMEAERVMFEHIMDGGSIEDALKIYQQYFNHSTSHPRDDVDDVELF